jgi:hypothetical protein
MSARSEARANAALVERAALRQATAAQWQGVLCPGVHGAPRAKRARYRTGRSLLGALFGKGGA